MEVLADSLHSLFHHLLGTKDNILNNSGSRLHLLDETGTLASHITAIGIALLHSLTKRSATE